MIWNHRSEAVDSCQQGEGDAKETPADEIGEDLVELTLGGFHSDHQTLADRPNPEKAPPRHLLKEGNTALRFSTVARRGDC